MARTGSFKNSCDVLTPRRGELSPLFSFLSFHIPHQLFSDVAYKARNREDLIAGIDEFLDEVIVLPPGEWDPNIRIEPPKKVPSADKRCALGIRTTEETSHGRFLLLVANQKPTRPLTNSSKIRSGGCVGEGVLLSRFLSLCGMCMCVFTFAYVWVHM